MTSEAEHASTIAVVGATGQQGGATAQALIEAGAAVRAVVRDTSSPATKRLHEQGAQLAEADLDQADTLVKAFQGADAVFAMATFTGPRGTDGEVEHGGLAHLPAYQADFELTRDLDPDVWDLRAWLASR